MWVNKNDNGKEEMLMALVTLKEMLSHADKHKYGVGMFDVHNLEMVNAAVAAAEQECSPIIIALAEVHAPTYREIDDISNIMVHAAKRAKVPVAVHFDHATSLEKIIRVMHNGFSSVMYDGSVLPYEENVRNSREVVRFAKIFDASVEAELGHVGGGEGGTDDEHGVQYTEPDQAMDFVEKTGVDCLAVSIGTAHGVYKEIPKLDIQRLKDIKKKVSVPLVLHGGSGLSDQDFRNCIYGGISKVNIYTEIVQTAVERINCELTTPFDCGCRNESRKTTISKEELINKITKQIIRELNPSTSVMKYPELMEQSVEGMKEAIVRKLRLFGSSGQV